MKCPKCNAECDRDTVDVGVGIIYGPWGCHECWWSSEEEYDLSDGKSQDHGEGFKDQYGGWTRKIGNG